MTELLDNNQIEQFRRKNMIWELLEIVHCRFLVPDNTQKILKEI